MSNRKRTRWSAQEITAANAADELAAVFDEIEAETVRRVVSGNLLADLTAYGHAPGLIAEVEQRLAAVSAEEWLEVGYTSGMLPMAAD